MGNTRVANVVAMGAYIGATGLFNREAAVEALDLHIKKKNLLPLNEKALDAGREAVAGA